MKSTTLRLLSILVLGLLLGGCAGLWTTESRHTGTSSLVEFLYPDRRLPEGPGRLPELRVPLTVGLAFVPSRTPGDIPPDLKQQLLEAVRARFQGEQYIRDIVIIPDHYLRSGAGYPGLESLQRLYGVDLFALISYDQLTRSGDNLLALSYLTILGAYLLPGTDYDVHTFVDLAVVDVPTRTLLLRAGGAAAGHGSAPAAYHDGVVRNRREAAFGDAMMQMTGQLQQELVRFRERLKQADAPASVSYRPGYSGGFGLLDLLLILGGGVLLLGRRRG